MVDSEDTKINKGGGKLSAESAETFRGSRGATPLWIKTACALSEQAPSGSICFDPATLSPGEALFGVEG